MFTNYGQNDLANTHRRELECEANGNAWRLVLVLHQSKTY